MDSVRGKLDWRRNAYETCFQVPSAGLQAVCLTCVRRCHGNKYSVAEFRRRQKSDICDCNKVGQCQCRWSMIREQFDKLSGEDECIGPNQLRELLTELRSPLPLDSVDLDEALLALSDGEEDASRPRITAQEFEAWYNGYFTSFT